MQKLSILSFKTETEMSQLFWGLSQRNFCTRKIHFHDYVKKAEANKGNGQWKLSR